MPSKKVIILGASGSIGRQTLECIEKANVHEPGIYEVVGVSVHDNHESLMALKSRYPKAALALSGCTQAPKASGIGFIGKSAIRDLLQATEAHLVVNGIMGSAGLEASYHALVTGKNLALANKESVVMGYSLLETLAVDRGIAIIPVDSEHAALYQLVQRIGSPSIQEICITASGGPFREWTAERMEGISPDEAARHPVWKMGRKISIDSATLANKGLELIEAARLFHFPEERIRILIHPQSVVHAMVRTRDGALFAHMSLPDMRLPIEIALSWPIEAPSLFPSLDLVDKNLSFFNPDTEKFPLLGLARRALRLGEAGTIAYNAADEVAVHAFEGGRIGFLTIARIVEDVLERDWSFPLLGLDSIFEYDAEARRIAEKAVMEREK
ncbi:MAG: 1-deoxy-D-xylulose-5-phosphate reductoisomerase [Spirochaetes bacterium]|nr:MAG: 1-deoxy-D-xylulose-5-phosphate reductoisomerase [Spirochaetota bacterium]